MLTYEDLSQIRTVMREEVEAETKIIKGELKLMRLHIVGLENRLKDVEISNSNIVKRIESHDKEFKKINENISTVDMKVELVNNKVDMLRTDTSDGFERIFEAMERNDREQKNNLKLIKDFVGMNS